jgi:hypothetical protein
MKKLHPLLIFIHIGLKFDMLVRLHIQNLVWDKMLNCHDFYMLVDDDNCAKKARLFG